MSRVESELKCPRCGSTEFLAGPRGGAAQNVKCAKCDYGMNVARLPDGGYWIIGEDGEQSGEKGGK
jgi:ribosomal protein S27AE